MAVGFWDQNKFLFLAVCMVLSAISSYAFSELLAWFPFPLFAMATVLWFGTEKLLFYPMSKSIALGMKLMTGILTTKLQSKGSRVVACFGHVMIWCQVITASR